MSGRNSTFPTLASLIGKDILSRAFLVALVIGSILTLINQQDAIFGSAAIQVLPIVLVYFTPFVVVTVSQALGIHRAILDAQSGYERMRKEDGFVATAISHGIPLRTLLLAAAVGVTNTLITALAVTVSSATPSELPTAIIAQAFALPMLFGLISQTISYRRAVAATGNNFHPSPKLLSR